MPEDRPCYLAPYDGSIRIEADGARFEVPANNTVLRVFQYLELERSEFELSYKDYCWNAECLTCKFRFRCPGSDRVEEALACQTKATDGIVIVALPGGVKRRNPQSNPR